MPENGYFGIALRLLDMTEKEEKILNAALELFANDGYNATSTSAIAKQAGVSEGLIFRHFESKKGLLQALAEMAENRVNQLFAPIVFESDPRKVIRRLIELPFHIDRSEYDFWRLQFKLKWEAEHHQPQKMKPLLDKLAWAFAELGYPHPEEEALLLNQIIESIATAILREGKETQALLESFLLEKYLV